MSRALIRPSVFQAIASCGFAIASISCGASNRVRPQVAPREVTIVNPNAAAVYGRLAVGMEPSAEITVSPNDCAVIRPPAGREGELRVQVLDPDHQLVVDLYGQRLVDTWQPCHCSAGSFSRCITAPAYHSAPPPPDSPPADAGARAGSRSH